MKSYNKTLWKHVCAQVIQVTTNDFFFLLPASHWILPNTKYTRAAHILLLAARSALRAFRSSQRSDSYCLAGMWNTIIILYTLYIYRCARRVRPCSAVQYHRFPISIIGFSCCAAHARTHVVTMIVDPIVRRPEPLTRSVYLIIITHIARTNANPWVVGVYGARVSRTLARVICCCCCRYGRGSYTIVFVVWKLEILYGEMYHRAPERFPEVIVIQLG